ncbi:MAG TPA: tRNA (guanosine(46)-N7)-methyltransferase TrmB [Candidatus Brachybacterium merdigallinarum]|nr:tRNA (guanosine(46)-N7)-methyltransferase TrmB [Candidatus Brachybacterium merdigallinarum]
MTSEPTRTPRHVVSFVRRGDRLTPSRQAAWDRLADTYVLDLPRGQRDTLPDPEARLDLPELFGRSAPLVVEIGSGQGENIAAAAAADPARDHLAVEVYAPGLAHTLMRLERADLPPNVRLLPLDAQPSLPQLLPPASITELWVFFPDPWRKARHHKRRLINPPFLDALLPLLADGARLRLATDWAQYAHHMRQVLDARPELRLLHPDGPAPGSTTADPLPEDMPQTGWAPRFEGRVLTSFENKGQEAGRLIWDLAYTRPPRDTDDD